MDLATIEIYENAFIGAGVLVMAGSLYVQTRILQETRKNGERLEKIRERRRDYKESKPMQGDGTKKRYDGWG